MPSPKFNLLLIDDDSRRADQLVSWLPAGIMTHVVGDKGQAAQMLRWGRDHVYGGVLLSADFMDQSECLASPGTVCSASVDLLDVLVRNLSRDTCVLVYTDTGYSGRPLGRILLTAGYKASMLALADIERQFFLDWLEYARYRFEDALGEGSADHG